VTNKQIIKAVVIGVTALVLLVFAYFFGRPPTPHLKYDIVSFKKLPGWRQDNVAQSLIALKRSCSVITRGYPKHYLTTKELPIVTADWLPVCKALSQLKHPTNAAARDFYEKWFSPIVLSDNGDTQGLFTGYYQPVVHGSLHPHGKYQIPLYAKPRNLIRVNLGHFRKSWRGHHLSGRVHNGWLIPYYKRREINAGKIKDTTSVLAWVDSRVERFFLQIQGSGVVQLDNGRTLQVGYAASNGAPYKAIGHVLIERGDIPREKMSMQSIRAWCKAHPDKVQAILNHNTAFVFFRIQQRKGAIGTQNVPLVPGRSIAVDNRFIPLGLPIWLVTTVPDPRDVNKAKPFRRLMVSQDTGGAIRGVVRADIFWGVGDKAGAIAGHMKNKGRYWGLVPKSAVKRFISP
jgi:peptidoglycan lytic transglycosylase A